MNMTEKKKADGIFHRLSFFVLLLFLFCFSTLRKTTRKHFFQTFSYRSYRIFQMYRTCQFYRIYPTYQSYRICRMCRPCRIYHLCPIYPPCRTYHPYRLFLLPSYPLFLFSNVSSSSYSVSKLYVATTSLDNDTLKSFNFVP